MVNPLVSSAKIKKVLGGFLSEADDLLAVEEPMEIRLAFGPTENRKQKIISVTMRTPGHDFELAIGFLFTEGIIKNRSAVSLVRYCLGQNTAEHKDNIVRVELKPIIEADFDKLQRNFYVTSSCGVCGKASIDAIRTVCEHRPFNSLLKINKDLIHALPNQLRLRQNVFKYTGGLHACALFSSDGSALLIREDVGRHNALDKLVGASLEMFPVEEGAIFSLENYILLLSGRASFELIQKAAMSGIKIVCAVGAPSSLAVEMAKEFDITLIGFLRDNRFNIYSHEGRVD